MNILGGLAPATPGFIAFLPPLYRRGVERCPPPLGLAPEIGARVVSLRCPILRPVSFSLRQLWFGRSRNLLQDWLPVG